MYGPISRKPSDRYNSIARSMLGSVSSNNRRYPSDRAFYDYGFRQRTAQPQPPCLRPHIQALHLAGLAIDRPQCYAALRAPAIARQQQTSTRAAVLARQPSQFLGEILKTQTHPQTRGIPFEKFSHQCSFGSACLPNHAGRFLGLQSIIISIYALTRIPPFVPRSGRRRADPGPFRCRRP